MVKKDKHKFYDFLEDLLPISKFRFTTIKTCASRVSFTGIAKPLNYCVLFFDMFYIVAICWRDRQSDFIFLREFNTLSFLFTSFFILPTRKKILLNVNHNFQRCMTSKIHKWVIIWLDFVGYRFFCFEGDVAPVRLNNKIVSIPFPVVDIIPQLETRCDLNEKITLGVVGGFRDEKCIPELLELLLIIPHKGFSFILGCDNLNLLEKYKNLGWTVYDTSMDEKYSEAMMKSDVLLFNYSASAYYYRHSGVLTDCLKAGKFVIAPSYPYFIQQLNTPISIGLTFDGEGEFSLCLNKVKDLVKSDFNKLYSKYFQFRQVENVRDLLDQQLELLL